MSEVNLTKEEIKELKLKANKIRRLSLEMIVKAKASHISPSLSMVELILVLYEKFLKHEPQNPEDPKRDRFLLSKGHGCASLYVLLAQRGFFPLDELDRYEQPGSILGGHPEMQKVPGIEISAGSLGHGLSIGVGMALSAKKDNQPHRIYCLVGDGECNEGTVWEAASCAAHFGLDNLTVIVDKNQMQISGFTKDVLHPQDFAGKWRAFGFGVREVDGHNLEEVFTAYASLPYESGRPSVIIGNTTKGKGISFMENVSMWHSALPSPEELATARADLQKIEDEILSSP